MSRHFKKLFGALSEETEIIVQAFDTEINDNLRGGLPPIIFGSEPPVRPYLFVSTAPSPAAWPYKPGFVMDQKVHDFYLKLLERYGLVIIVTGCHDPVSGNNGSSVKKDTAERARTWNRVLLQDRLTRLQPQPHKTAEKIATAYMAMRSDIDRIWKLFKELLPGKCEAIVSTPEAMLRAMACFHLAGEMAYKELRAGIKALSGGELSADQIAACRLAAKIVRKGSFGYDDDLNRLVGKYTSEPKGADIPGQTWVARAELRAFQLGRDFSRWLLSGAFNWVRERKESKRPIKILFVDPQLDPKLDGKRKAQPFLHFRLRDRLEVIFGTLFCESECPPVVDLICAQDGLLPQDKLLLGDSVVAFDQFLTATLKERVYRVPLGDWKPGEPFPRPEAGKGWFKSWDLQKLEDGDNSWSLWDYDAIFCEVTYEQRFAGPQIVQKLRSYFERTHRKGRDVFGLLRKASTAQLTSEEIIKEDQMPAIIVLTQSANFNFIHQCLNLGAHAYVAKDRLFEIPFRMWAAIRDEERAALHRAQAYKAGTGKERIGHRSNFRNLYSLRVERIVELQRSDGRHLITGSEVDRPWIKRLPKADLHRHFGTSIRLKTFEALAFNSVGHLVTKCAPRRAKGADARDTEREGSHLHDAILLSLSSVIACAVFRHAPEGRRWKPMADGTPAQLLLAATAWISKKFREDAKRGGNQASWHPSESLKEEYWHHEKPLEEVIRLLAPVGSPIRLYQATSLIVAATRLLRPPKDQGGKKNDQRRWIEKEIKGRWQYLGDIDTWMSSYDSPENMWFEAFVKPAAKDCWEQSCATQWVPDTAFTPATYFTKLHRAVETRIARAVSDMYREIGAAKKLVAKYIAAEKDFAGVGDKSSARKLVEDSMPEVPSLAVLVMNQLGEFGDIIFPRKLGLSRYLWGCGLLGADHLQFPENLVLGAKDLIEQNAEECVVYSEVRCETPGYTVAGMSAAGATDLLLKSFDLAAAYYRETGGFVGAAHREGQVKNVLTLQSPHGATFIRTNILLAAKRHKKRGDCASVVGLLERYLSVGPRLFEHEVEPSVIPNWWKPCSVVGFDLSGNESQPAPEVEEEIQRLFKYSSPITIHAGEAATAESVWQAVYKLHGRRIGHGLRLRENPNLLRYCINEGICMEMCPVSNMLTHGFLTVPDEQSYLGLAQEHYPLRYYMAAGLEVCINTDNRSLHQPVNQPFDPDGEGATITDDYLMAAKLSGGFSRWELLKLVRAGLKHAFISKVDISDLLSAAENRVYTLVAHENGLDWRPKPWSGSKA